MKVSILDYGVGNIHSLQKALEGEGASVCVTPDGAEALVGDALVLPGVGGFEAAAAALSVDRSLLRNALLDGLPCLGICLGMQLLFDGSEEGGGRGLGVIPGRVRRLAARVVPQMGWNDVEVSADPLFEELPALTAYYAHSYVCEPDDPASVVARSRHEDDVFAAAVRRGSVWGVQFHPEKSSDPGRRLIRNFLTAAAALPARVPAQRPGGDP